MTRQLLRAVSGHRRRRGAACAIAEDLLVYECDGYVVEKNVPDVVLLPTIPRPGRGHRQDVQRVRRPLRAPGAGTSLAGGCLPVGGGVMIALTRMKRILEVNLRDRYAVVEPGLVNVHLTQRLKGTGYHYAPDPSSQGACTIGGNVATNSGGPHTLKYGVTVNHVLGVEVVLPDGSVVELGGPTGEPSGYDLTGLFVGSEGTFGICTRVTVRLTRNPAAYRTLLGIFETVDAATQAISSIIGAGIIPAALEMMDQGIVEAVEGGLSFRLSTRRRRRAVDRGRRPGSRRRRRGGKDRAPLPVVRRPGSPPGDVRKGTDAPVEVPQTGLRSDRPLEPELLHAGRRRAADAAAGDPRVHHRLRERGTASAS